MQGESTASVELTELFRVHCDFVWRALRYCGLSEAEAEDGVQEVFLIVSQKLAHYQERGTMRAWLATIARHVATNLQRSNARRSRRQELSGAPAPLPGPHEVAEHREAARLVEQFLAQLEEGQSAVFFLSELEGLSAPEIATALELPLTTVYARQRRSRARFSSFMKRQSGGGRP